MILIEVQTESVHGQFISRLIDLHQVSDTNSRLQSKRRLFQITCSTHVQSAAGESSVCVCV